MDSILKIKLLLSLILIALSMSQVQAQGTLRTYYNINADGFRPSAVRTPDNGFVFAGTVGTFNKDIYVVKTNLWGDVQWSYQLSKPQNEQLVSLQYNPLDTTIYVLYNDNNFDGSILKLSMQGQFIWDRALDLGNMSVGTGSTKANLVISSDNHLLLTSYSIDSTNTYHLGMAKLDNEADTLWTRFYSVPNHSTFAQTVLEVSDGNYLLVGNIDTSYAQGNGNGTEVYLIKTDTAGNPLWTVVQPSSVIASAQSVIETTNGDFIILGYENVGNNRKMLVMRVDALGQQLWQWTSTGNNSAYNNALDALENADGSLTITGFWSAAASHSVAFTKFSASGQLLYHNGIGSGQAVAHGKYIWHNPNNGYAIFGVDGQGPFLMTVDSVGTLFTNRIFSRIFLDQNGNCSYDAGEPLLSNSFVHFQKNNGLHDVTLGGAGTFLMEADTGTYSVSAQTFTPYWAFCQNPQTVDFTGFNQTDTVDFPVTVIDSCTYMTVSVSSPFLRRCFPSDYWVSYQNLGTIPAQNVYVEVTLDPYISFDSSSVPLIAQNGNTYSFDIGNVGVFGSGMFIIYTTVGCDPDVSLGQIHCTEARIYPDTICMPAWTGPVVSTSATCTNDTVTFTISNNAAAMSQPHNFAIMEDQNIIVLSTFQLGSGQSQDLQVAALPGKTYRIEADQAPSFPPLLGAASHSTFIHDCNGPAQSSGGQTQFFNGNSHPAIDIDCRPNQGAYDPNDKQAQPIGYGPQHFIENNIPLNYHIRFQNTGTDTAINVFIVDSISPYLSIEDIQFGTSSHPYTWELKAGGALVFYFDNIMLPDSNVNEPASHGFVKFQIKQKAGNPDGTVINNRADIYFDFNEPILTNTVFHTIGHDFVTIELLSIDQNLKEEAIIRIYPNPFSGQTQLSLEGIEFEELHLEIFDINGRLLFMQNTVNENVMTINAQGFSPGLYLYRLSSDGQLLNSGKLQVK
ncbi:MAG: T9SS C-terminal target domain-containing protein [Chitinophagaceae bacterium]|nr:MAG: T9SS C-terminal target domain-containing protein [Chitinophagaceae bacterium]